MTPLIPWLFAKAVFFAILGGASRATRDLLNDVANNADAGYDRANDALCLWVEKRNSQNSKPETKT